MDAVERFAALVAGSEPDLDRGALAIAAGADPGLDTDRWLRELDRLAQGVGRRAGVPLEGVGMPGHFLLRSVDGEHYVDAFAGGALLDLAGCEALFRSATGAVYARSVRPAEVEWVLRMLLALPGAGAAEVAELGSALGQQGRFLDGAAVLESGAQQFPQYAEALGYAARGLRAHLNGWR